MITGSPQAEVQAGDNYFVYLPENQLCQSWGCTALSTGHTRIGPESVYPPARHPDDHHFVWEKGRTIQAYQFILISEGCGQIETGPEGAAAQKVGPGDVMLLYPGVWHRFSPDRQTGWTEHWIECTGAAFDAVMARGLFPLSKPLWHGGARIAAIFDEIHQRAVSDALGQQPAISTLGLQMLAEFCQSRQTAERGRSRLVEQTRRLLMETSDRPNALSTVADELGVSYSTLRRVFRAQTGLSLKAYQDEVRIRRACELLRSSNKSVKEIAGLLGYNSPYHFSSQFRKATGLAPANWRKRNGPSWLQTRHVKGTGKL
ncbi:AraC family transcriptional regulator [Marinovum sp.]|uniref:AraC family transcriptional regulator n=1 Tax=Marinovum sp. TaxID=2024839 RepID=UPI002B26CF9A|nr:AraC family transcriptional regulator [Marinovum sp.]